MYSLNVVGKNYEMYKEKNPLYKRVKIIKSSKEKGMHNVVYIVPSYYSQSVRYRAENMVNIISALPDWNSTIFETFNVKIIHNCLDYVDAIIFIRTRYDELAEFIYDVKKKRIPAYYDIDDFRFSKDCMSPKEMGNSSADINLQYQKLASLCDGFITTTSFLKRNIENFFRKKTYLIKNFMSYNQECIARRYIEEKCNNPSSEIDDCFCLGYFAGKTHFRDLEIISDDVATFLMRHEKTMLRIIGVERVPDSLKKEEIRSQVKIFPFMDGNTLMREFAEIDLNLIPLIMDDYSQARSEIKYFEAAIVGTISLMSPTDVYCEIINKGNIGRVCKDNKWLDSIEEIYEKRKDLKRNMPFLFKEAQDGYGADSRKKELEIMLNEVIV